MYTNKIDNPGDANAWTRAYLDSILIEMRHLDGVVPDTTLNLYGKVFDTPVMIAAFSHLDATREDGMAQMARGAKLANAVNWAGMGDEEELERILSTGAGTIKIVKPYADRDMVYRKLKFAYEAGALAVGMDIDHSFGSKGQPDNVRGFLMHSVSQEELQSFVEATPLPFIVKGVLSVQDALKCRDCGVRGIMVSHHHGIIPYAVPPLMALPRILEAVGKDMDVFVDCGIAVGADVYKALALGAKAVCVGRAILPALRDGGAEGVRAYIEGMNDELRGIMARTASRDLASIQADTLWIPGAGWAAAKPASK